ncbi:MAG: peptidylprolyl isomerase [Planctomycetota bacterium]
MALLAATAFGSLLAPGCAAIKQKWDAAIATDIDSPVIPAQPIRVPGAIVSEDPGPVGPAPVQLAGAEGSGASQLASAGGVSPAGGAPPPHFDDADVVATVNGMPVLAGDLLQFEVGLNEAAARLAAAPDKADAVPGGPPGITPAQRAMLKAQIDTRRAQILAQRLPAKIEEALLAQRMERTLQAEQLEKLNDAVSTLFEQTELPKMIQKASQQAAQAGLPPVETKQQLQRLMAQQGLDYDAVVAAWKPQQMAMAYVEQNSGMASIRISRQEVQDYYDAHLEDFLPPRAARWEQIEIPYPDDDGKSAALDLLEAAAADLKRGRPFAEVARTYGRGPNAEKGGRWDWTPPEALTDETLAQALWTQPIDVIGAAIDCPLSPDGFPPGGAYRIIRVLERRGEAPPPLDDLRTLIEERIKADRRRAIVADLIARERETAQIEVYVPGTQWPPEE